MLYPRLIVLTLALLLSSPLRADLWDSNTIIKSWLKYRPRSYALHQIPDEQFSAVMTTALGAKSNYERLEALFFINERLHYFGWRHLINYQGGSNKDQEQTLRTRQEAADLLMRGLGDLDPSVRFFTLTLITTPYRDPEIYWLPSDYLTWRILSKALVHTLFHGSGEQAPLAAFALQYLGYRSNELKAIVDREIASPNNAFRNLNWSMPVLGKQAAVPVGEFVFLNARNLEQRRPKREADFNSLAAPFEPQQQERIRQVEVYLAKNTSKQTSVTGPISQEVIFLKNALAEIGQQTDRALLLLEQAAGPQAVINAALMLYKASEIGQTLSNRYLGRLDNQLRQHETLCRLGLALATWQRATDQLEYLTGQEPPFTKDSDIDPLRTSPRLTQYHLLNTGAFREASMLIRDRLIPQHPRNRLLWFRLAILAIHQRQWADAERALENTYAIDKRPFLRTFQILANSALAYELKQPLPIAQLDQWRLEAVTAFNGNPEAFFSAIYCEASLQFEHTSGLAQYLEKIFDDPTLQSQWVSHLGAFGLPGALMQANTIKSANERFRLNVLGQDYIDFLKTLRDQ